MAYNAVAFLAAIFRSARQLWPADLPADWRDAYEERAAIMEFCGNLRRQEAERRALAETLRRMGAEKKGKGLDKHPK